MRWGGCRCGLVALLDGSVEGEVCFRSVDGLVLEFGFDYPRGGLGRLAGFVFVFFWWAALMQRSGRAAKNGCLMAVVFFSSY